MVASVQVEGAKELARLFRQIGDKDLQKANREAFKRGAQVVVEAAMPRVPVRSGRLRSSVRATATQSSGSANAGGARVAYAAAIHWGRKSGNVGSPPGNHNGRNPIAARPFLWDAAQRSAGRVEEIYRQEVMQLFDRAGEVI